MRPDIFAELELEAARQRAIDEHKLLVVDATATWCGPCQMMDRSTWLDPMVGEWFREHALAIQIDVDVQKDVARDLRINAMPTIIAFADGKEFDRVVGAKKPKELLSWLDGVRRGETSLVVHKRAVRGAPADIRARLVLARELTENGRYEEAIVEHSWLWEHILEHQPGMYGVRRSFFAADLETLSSAYEPARAAITELRDRAAPPAEGPFELEMFRDWTCLNGVLGERARTLAWYDALPFTRRPQLGPLLEHEIVPLLIEVGRWAEAGALYEKPLSTLNRAADRVADTAKRSGRPELAEYMRNDFRDTAARLVRALRTAGRSDDASSVDTRAREIDPSRDGCGVEPE